MNYEEVLAAIHSRGQFGIKPGLERVEKVLNLLGNPQDKLKFIHVAGTNGKGSVCKMLSLILANASYCTGLFTSPYVLDFRERFQINNEMISKDELVELFLKIKPALRVAEQDGFYLTEFELITVMAFVWFYQKKCDIVGLEVGLGGRLDATNIIKASEVSVITSISLDHVKILGNTVDAIAREKAGILKNGGKLVLAEQEKIAAELAIKEVAKSLSCKVITASTSKFEILGESIFGTDFIYNGQKYFLNLCGIHQIKNVAVVFKVVESLQNFVISHENIKHALEKIKFLARFDVISPGLICGLKVACSGNTAGQFASTGDNIAAVNMKCSVAQDEEATNNSKFFDSTNNVFKKHSTKLLENLACADELFGKFASHSNASGKHADKKCDGVEQLAEQGNEATRGGEFLAENSNIFEKQSSKLLENLACADELFGKLASHSNASGKHADEKYDGVEQLAEQGSEATSNGKFLVDNANVFEKQSSKFLESSAYTDELLGNFADSTDCLTKRKRGLSSVGDSFDVSVSSLGKCDLCSAKRINDSIEQGLSSKALSECAKKAEDNVGPLIDHSLKAIKNSKPFFVNADIIEEQSAKQVDARQVIGESSILSEISTECDVNSVSSTEHTGELLEKLASHSNTSGKHADEKCDGIEQLAEQGSEATSSSKFLAENANVFEKQSEKLLENLAYTDEWLWKSANSTDDLPKQKRGLSIAGDSFDVSVSSSGKCDLCSAKRINDSIDQGLSTKALSECVKKAEDNVGPLIDHSLKAIENSKPFFVNADTNEEQSAKQLNDRQVIGDSSILCKMSDKCEVNSVSSAEHTGELLEKLASHSNASGKHADKKCDGIEQLAEQGSEATSNSKFLVDNANVFEKQSSKFLESSAYTGELLWKSADSTDDLPKQKRGLSSLGDSFDVSANSSGKCSFNSAGRFQNSIKQKISQNLGNCRRRIEPNFFIEQDSKIIDDAQLFRSGNTSLPIMIIDGAHNPDSIKKLSVSVGKFLSGKKVIGVVAMMKDKDAETSLKFMAPYLSSVVVTEVCIPRSFKSYELLKISRKIFNNVYEEVCVCNALKKAVSLCDETAVILVFGSFYLAGEVYDSIGLNGFVTAFSDFG